MRIFLLSSLIAGLVFGLTGCMHRPQPEQPMLSKQARLHLLQQMQVWQAEGRVSIQERNQAQTASYRWQQEHQNFRAYFYSPFSSQSLTLRGNATQVTVEAVQGMTAEEVELEQNLPLAQLGYWAKGIPTPTTTVEQAIYDSCNQLTKLQQDGWLVEYQSYAKAAPISLPEKITLCKGPIKVKLTIKR